MPLLKHDAYWRNKHMQIGGKTKNKILLIWGEKHKVKRWILSKRAKNKVTCSEYALCKLGWMQPTSCLNCYPSSADTQPGKF